MENIEFPTGSVPVLVAARVYGKEANWVRTGIIAGWLPIGKATRIWKNALKFLNAYPDVSTVKDIKSNKTSNPVLDYVETADYYNQRIKMVEDTAKEVDGSLAEYLIKGITEGLSYDNLRIRTNIPCCKDVYYELYRKFFWLLNKKRL